MVPVESADYESGDLHLIRVSKSATLITDAENSDESRARLKEKYKMAQLTYLNLKVRIAKGLMTGSENQDEN